MLRCLLLLVFFTSFSPNQFNTISCMEGEPLLNTSKSLNEREIIIPMQQSSSYQRSKTNSNYRDNACSCICLTYTILSFAAVPSVIGFLLYKYFGA